VIKSHFLILSSRIAWHPKSAVKRTRGFQTDVVVDVVTDNVCGGGDSSESNFIAVSAKTRSQTCLTFLPRCLPTVRSFTEIFYLPNYCYRRVRDLERSPWSRLPLNRQSSTGLFSVVSLLVADVGVSFFFHAPISIPTSYKDHPLCFSKIPPFRSPLFSPFLIITKCVFYIGWMYYW